MRNFGRRIDTKNAQPLTSGFTQAGVYARRRFCGNLEVHRPPEPLWNPRLREAATTLAASGESVVDNEARIENCVQYDK